ncbi:MAG: FtsQ-type POTRA domain-containing protein [Rhodospirillaceae bacterium]
MAAGLIVVLVAIGAGGTWWAWRSGAVANSAEKLRWKAIAASSHLGFKVDEILVVGRSETKQEELLDAVRLARGAPILAFDLGAARTRVEALPWIRRATVERMLPDTILINVEERRPVAIWQHNGRYSLIDDNGEVILRRGLERFSDLIVVVGEDAPRHATRLLETLGMAPELVPWVRAAVWVGGRRWNLRLKGDIDVRLPEINPAGAWKRLAEYEKTHGVLERDVQVLDLRLPDRLIVRKNPNAEGKPRKGQET